MVTQCSQCGVTSRSMAPGDGCHACLRGTMQARARRVLLLALLPAVFGFVSWVPEVTPQPPAWVVADSWAGDTRPAYDFRQFFVKRVEVGRAPVGAPCHFGTMKESTRGREWHPYQLPGGVYGVTLCTPVPASRDAPAQ